MNLVEIQKSLPANIAARIAGAVWRENTVGYSSVKVFRVEADAAFYLKINDLTSKFSLYEEKIRLEWLKNRLPVADVVMYEADEKNEYFLTTEVAGVDGSDDSLKKDIPRVIEELAVGLKMIHALPVEDCPFDARLESQIEVARERMLNGQIDEDDFDEERLGRTPENVFREMLANKPAREDLVFTHGDYCIPNVILDDYKLSGFIDLAEAGVADRYQDLALLSRSVRDNFGAEYEEKVFEFYGIVPDLKKIHFFRLLDEFF